MSREADVICRCLMGRRPLPHETERYVEAIGILAIEVDARLWRIACRHPVLLGLVDAGLAVLRPEDGMRRRIHLFSAIVEASPQSAADFLTPPSWPLAILLGARALVRTGLGVVLVWLLR